MVDLRKTQQGLLALLLLFSFVQLIDCIFKCTCPSLDAWSDTHKSKHQEYCGNELTDDPRICDLEAVYECKRTNVTTVATEIWNCSKEGNPHCYPRNEKYCKKEAKYWFDRCMAGRSCENVYLTRQYNIDVYGPNLEKLALLRSKINYA
jgi:hypothetical protein